MTFQQWLYRNVYLNSPGWKLTRWLFKGKFCQRCGNTESLELHHKEYKWHNRHPILRYFVPNLWDRMETLDSRCHRLEHKKHA